LHSAKDESVGQILLNLAEEEEEEAAASWAEAGAEEEAADLN